MLTQEVDQPARSRTIGTNRMLGSTPIRAQMRFPIGRLLEGRMRIEG